ncbi:hypothetical protein NHQ30_002051 [Ciborinia camelliae]|nr:hypothetical protein NHQ30_002051 [Ciborinia camelliae]
MSPIRTKAAKHVTHIRVTFKGSVIVVIIILAIMAFIGTWRYLHPDEDEWCAKATLAREAARRSKTRSAASSPPAKEIEEGKETAIGDSTHSSGESVQSGEEIMTDALKGILEEWQGGSCE